MAVVLAGEVGALKGSANGKHPACPMLWSALQNEQEAPQHRRVLGGRARDGGAAATASANRCWQAGGYPSTASARLQGMLAAGAPAAGAMGGQLVWLGGRRLST